MYKIKRAKGGSRYVCIPIPHFKYYLYVAYCSEGEGLDDVAMDVLKREGISVDEQNSNTSSEEKDLIISFETDSEDWNSSLNAAVTYSSQRERVSLLCFPSGAIDLSIIVHEIVHVVYSIFRSVDSKLTGDTEEFYSYLSEYLFREIYYVLDKVIKVKKLFVAKY